MRDVSSLSNRREQSTVIRRDAGGEAIAEPSSRSCNRSSQGQDRRSRVHARRARGPTFLRCLRNSLPSVRLQISVWRSDGLQGTAARPPGRKQSLVKAIGIDFGTTNSALALARPDGTVQLARFKGETTFRSILYFDEHDSARTSKLRVVAGADAIQSYLNAKTPGRLIQSMKSYLASRLFNQTQIMGETYSLQEVIGILLRYLRQSAEAA